MFTKNLTAYVIPFVLGAFVTFIAMYLAPKETGPANFDECFDVDEANPPAPHTQVGDRFCVRRQNGGPWRLVPDADMTDWKAIGGGTEIPLQLTHAEDPDDWDVLKWEFDVDVMPHSGQNHTNEHKRPNTGFKLWINNGEPMDARIKGFGPVGSPIHGGTAHAQQD
jgi:hypothetical protein